MFDLSTDTEMTMSSREIAELLGKQHGHLKISAERLVEKGTIALRESKFNHNGNEYIEYLLNKRDSLILVAQNSPEFTAAIVDRWQELEKQTQPKIPQTYADALLLAANQAKELEEKNQALALAAPKAEFVDRYVESTGLMTFRQVAKQLEIKETAFRSFLVAIKAMYLLNGSWVAYQSHIDSGKFKQKAGEKNGHAFVTTKFTAKGVEWIAKKWGEVKGMAA